MEIFELKAYCTYYHVPTYQKREKEESKSENKEEKYNNLRLHKEKAADRVSEDVKPPIA